MIVAVIGLGALGRKTAISLYEKGAEVVAVDCEEELVEKIKDRVTHAVCLDVTDERSLREVNISDVDLAFVAIGEDIKVSILAVAMLRKLGVSRVVARATSILHEHVLKEIGASEIIKVEETMGEIMASRIVAPHVLQEHSFTDGYSLVELDLGKNFAHKTIEQSEIKQNYLLSFVVLKRKVPFISEEGKSSYKIEAIDFPEPKEMIEENDIAVLTGHQSNFQRLLNDISEI